MGFYPKIHGLLMRIAPIPFSLCVAVIPFSCLAQVVQSQTPLLSTQQTGRISLVPGDRLSISVFEKVELDNDKWAVRKRADRPDQSFYPRQDLTGDFIVQPDGTLPMPLLGNIRAEGRTGGEVADDIAQTFLAVVGRTARVTQALVERPTVSIIGPVHQPGTFKYVDGMSVMHLLAIAGGLRQSDDNWARVELAKEQAKLSATLERYQRRQIEARLLEAERDGKSDDQALLGLTNISPALVDEVRGGRTRIRQAYQQRKATLEAARTIAEEALDIARERFEEGKASVVIRGERVDALKALAAKNVVSQTILLEASMELSDAKERKLEAESLVSEAKLRVSSAKDELARFTLETQVGIDNLLAQRLLEASEARSDLDASQTIVSMLAPGGEAGALTAFDIEIVRRDGSGWQTLPASVTSTVEPGDLVKLDPKPGGTILAN